MTNGKPDEKAQEAQNRKTQHFVVALIFLVLLCIGIFIGMLSMPNWGLGYSIGWSIGIFAVGGWIAYFIFMMP